MAPLSWSGHPFLVGCNGLLISLLASICITLYFLLNVAAKIILLKLKPDLLKSSFTFHPVFIYSVNIVRHQQNTLHCAKTQQYDPIPGEGWLVSNHSRVPIDAVAERCTGSLGKERKGPQP